MSSCRSDRSGSFQGGSLGGSWVYTCTVQLLRDQPELLLYSCLVSGLDADHFSCGRKLKEYKSTQPLLGPLEPLPETGVLANQKHWFHAPVTAMLTLMLPWHSCCCDSRNSWPVYGGRTQPKKTACPFSHSWFWFGQKKIGVCFVYPHTHLSTKLQIDIILTVLNALPFKQANISVEIYSADASLITWLALNIPHWTLHNLHAVPALHLFIWNSTIISLHLTFHI